MGAPKSVLAWVNRQRGQKLGLKPIKEIPKGVCNDRESCVIALALTKGTRRVVSTGSTRSLVASKKALVRVEIEEEIDPNHSSAVEIRHPQYVVRFIDRFDLGLYPELEL